jgi:hypothetical protein
MSSAAHVPVDNSGDFEDDATPETPEWVTAGTFDPLSFRIAPVVAERSTEQIGEENSFGDIPVGEPVELVVRGMATKGGVPSATRKLWTAYIGERQASYEAWTITLRLVAADNPRLSALYSLRLPPEKPSEQAAYQHGASRVGGKPGYWYDVYVWFLNAIGFHWPKGQPTPSEALDINNWVGRYVVGEAELEDQKNPDGSAQINVATGQPYPPRVRLKPFCFTPSERASGAGTATAAAPPFEPKPRHQPPAQSAKPAPVRQAEHPALGGQVATAPTTATGGISPPGQRAAGGGKGMAGVVPGYPQQPGGLAGRPKLAGL